MNELHKIQAAWIVVAAWLCIPTAVGAQGVSDRGCYGDTFEVILVNQITGEPKIPMSIPLDSFPVMNGYPPNPNGSAPDPARECFKEPVLVKDVYFYPNSKPSSVLGIPAIGPFVRRFEIHYGWGWEDQHYIREQKAFEKSKAEGKAAVLSNGFTKLYSTPTISGEYRAPDNYTEPKGKPLQFHCNNMECNIGYPLKQDVFVNYRFEPDKIELHQWIELDQLMREVAVKFVDPDYLKNFKPIDGGN